MYRDETSAFRERYELARGSVRTARREVEEQRELVEALRGQLTERGDTFPEPPKLEPPRAFAEPAPDSKAVELVRLADEAEKEAARLVARRDSLARLATLLNRRLQGEAVALPLGAPPRRVPWTYFVAELASWPATIVMAALVAFGAEDASSSGFGSMPLQAVLPVAAIAADGLVPFVLWAVLRTRFLARCLDAVSTNVVSSGGDGSRMTNWTVHVSRGWDVSAVSYTGPGKRDVVEFLTHDGRRGRVTVTGAGYESGVVLYDPETLRAYDVKQLACSPQPDTEGRWTGKLSRRVWVKTFLFILALLAGVVYVLASVVARLL